MGLERVFEAPRTLRRLRSKPLGMLLDDFCDWLLDQGFEWHGVRRHLGNVSHLNAWLSEDDSRCMGRLSRREVEDFLEAYPCRCRNRGPVEEHLKRVRHSVNRFVGFLQQRGFFDPLIPAPVYQPLLEDYLTWMREHQHAAEGTLDIRRHSVGRFLEWLEEEAFPEGLAALEAHHVEGFFIDYARSAGDAARRSMQAALRTFLRFCLHEGHIRHRLDLAVPTLRTYRLARVPRGLGEAQAQAVLESVDRATAMGRRDYAILTLLQVYGVRGGQVRGLHQTDIRWAEDQILFRAIKGGKDSLLPLTPAVGESLLDYLQNARPRCSFPEVFLTARAPRHPLLASSSLSEIVRRRICAAGIDPPCKGSHAFRHAFATRMVADGHSLKAVADVLGHRHLSTTFVYTKVDFNALDQVAMEWPGEVAP
jgi:integrase/recombinase XerD